MIKKSGKSIDKFKHHYLTKAEYTSQVVSHQQYGEPTIIQRVLSISGGAGFLLSTVADFFFLSKRFLWNVPAIEFFVVFQMSSQ